jgi:hypothetical protein
MIDYTGIAAGLRRRLNAQSVCLYVTSAYDSRERQNRITAFYLHAMIEIESKTYSHRVQLASTAPTMADVCEAFHGAYDDARSQECHCCGITKNWPAWAELDKEIVHGF